MRMVNDVDTSDVWAQDGVTIGSSYDLKTDEYINWIEKTGVDVVFFDQNMQFEEIKAIRDKGVITIGLFVWESFGPLDVEGARSAFNCIYSLTKCEQKRYKSMGVVSPYVNYGCFPELLNYNHRKTDNFITFFYPGGYLSKRKPKKEVIEAFSLVKNNKAMLLLKIPLIHILMLITIWWQR